MNREHIQVQGIEIIKQGTSTNGPWHLYRVTTAEKKYSTFLEGLQIGQEYDVLVENKPFKGSKDGKMHDGWTITGFNNVVYEQKQERPVQTVSHNESSSMGNNFPASAIPNNFPTGFTEKDRQTLEAIASGIDKLVKYTTGELP